MGLFHSRFKTFERLAARFGIKRAHAYRLIAGAKIVRLLRPIEQGCPMPRAESQIRALAFLAPEDVRTTWIEACSRAETTGEPVTGALVESVARERWPELVRPDRILGKEKRVLLLALKPASAALRKFRAAPNSDPTALALLKEAVSTLRAALQ